MSRAIAWLLVLAPLVAHAGGGGVQHKPDGRPIKLLHERPAAKGTILMFHGFSSGPQHWADEAALRYAQGYDVIVAALPGHGFVDKQGRQDISRVPTATQSQKYVKFAQGMFDLARSRSDKVHVIGFSVGGAHALEVALAQKDVLAKDGSPVLRSTVAVNPYIGPNPIAHIDVERVLEVADRLTFGLTAKLMSHRSYVFHSAEKHALEGGHDVGFTQVTYNHVLGIGRFGGGVRSRAMALTTPLRQPTYVVLSAQDPTANPRKGAAVATAIGARQIVLPLSVHDPMSPETDPSAEMRGKVRDTISEALKRGEALR